MLQKEPEGGVWWVGFRAHADERNSVWSTKSLPADADAWSLPPPFVAEGDPVFSTSQMVLKTSVTPPPRPFRGLPTGERLSLCFAWCLLHPEPVALHSFVSLSQGCKMPLLEKLPGLAVLRLGCSAIATPGILQ